MQDRQLMKKRFLTTLCLCVIALQISVAEAADSGWTAGVCVSGSGVYRWTYGDRYEGQCLNYSFHGQGTFKWNNGNSYTGQWGEGLQHGRGEKTWANGDRYEGQWQNDRMNGLGTYHYVNSNRYIGGFQDDQISGQGTYFFPMAIGISALGFAVNGMVSSLTPIRAAIR